MIKIIGVYTITNTLNNMIYVGCSKDVNKRIKEHFRDLIKGVHGNNYLQNSVNKNGIDFFKFELLEECDIENIYSLENYWCNILNTHNRKNGYNIRPTSPYGKSGNSKETNIKIGILKRGNKNCVGRIMTEKTLRKISVSNSKYTYLQYDLQGNFIKEWLSYDLNKSIFNLSNIYRCCKGKLESHGNYIWRFKEEKEFPLKICNLNYLSKHNKRRGGIKKGGFQKSSWKTVLKICPISFEILDVFDSPSIVERKNNYSISTISKCCHRNKIKNIYNLSKSNGFIWIYKKENKVIIKENKITVKIKENEQERVLQQD